MTTAGDIPMSDASIRGILTSSRTFACVGMSADPVRPSHYVGLYLHRRGYRVVSVNPSLAGRTLFDEPACASLTEVQGPVDVLDVFRRSEAVPEIVEEALRTLQGLRCVWLQIGVRSAEARVMCREAGVGFVEDRCPKIEHQRLFGELRKGGLVTGIVSSRRPPLP